MHSPLPPLIQITTLILWSLYTDEFLSNGRLLVALLFTGIYLMTTFVLNPHRLERRFLFMWVLGLIGLLLFSFAWGLGSGGDGNSKNTVPYWPSSIFFLILSLVELGPLFSVPLNAEKAKALFFTYFSVIIMFASLVFDGKLSYSPYLTVLVYVPIGLFLLDMVRRQNTALVLDTLLVLSSMLLAARRWTGATNVYWILIVQPLIGLIFLSFISSLENGARGRLISSTANKKI